MHNPSCRPESFCSARDRSIPIRNRPPGGIRFKGIKVGAQSAGPVAHRVREFAQNMRLGMVGHLAEAFHLLNGGIHRAHYIAHLGFAVLFVMDQPRGIILPAPVRHCAEIATEAGFVAEGPEQHGRMVLSRSTIRRTRSTYASFHSGSSLRREMLPSGSKPWVSRSVSSITYSPYTSHSS